MSLVLDTDHLTLVERGGSGSLALEMRLVQFPEGEIATTIITYEEQMRGWMTRVSQASTPERMVATYARLSGHIETFANLVIFPFDVAAAEQYEVLVRMRVRIGTQDLRIALICLAIDATLLTRNMKDFGKVPGLRAEDWSA